MTKDKLVHTQHMFNSVVEVYITPDKETWIAIEQGEIEYGKVAQNETR